MTARERAVKEMVGLWIGDEIQSQPVESEDAEALCDLIESAGLRIVDRELFEALVEAVRAAMWADARSWAARYPWLQQVNNRFHESELANERTVATLAHRHAIELLERGE